MIYHYFSQYKNREWKLNLKNYNFSFIVYLIIIIIFNELKKKGFEIKIIFN